MSTVALRPGFRGGRAVRRTRLLGRLAGTWAAILLCGLVAAGCDGPHAVPDSILRDVSLVSPHAANQALILSFDRPIEHFEPEPGVSAYQDPGRGPASLVLVSERPLAPGETRLGTVSLRPDAAASEPSARVLEVSRSDFQLRDDLSGYRVRLLYR